MIKITNFHGMSNKNIKNRIRKSKDIREYERWLCINYSMKGFSVPEIAQMLFRNEKTIREWITNFNLEGPKGIEREHPPGLKKKTK